MKKKNCIYRFIKISISEIHTNNGYGRTFMNIVMLCAWKWIQCLLDDVLYQSFYFFILVFTYDSV
jgi:hypothetical protein